MNGYTVAWLGRLVKNDPIFLAAKLGSAYLRGSGVPGFLDWYMGQLSLRITWSGTG
jgi:hypothetical protein